ncbi:hypothetical protein RHGRI_020069 [Rhododendron griersonianum]|uniref:Uncharacterized protein n=1 Tax=Rhododendron griersonianum TaxID=479676 RepID=A0AAV6JHV7_9ERIC|nr:hypothetical protein RHGRI_020069 [Rhododendron griersonianum]
MQISAVSSTSYEYTVLLELLKKGHLEPEKKIGEGILAFQVRYHPQWKSRCFFLVRNDETVDDFSFRKCVDHILPLPENMQIKSDVNKALGGGGRGHGGRGGGGRGSGHGRGRGRGGRGRGGRSLLLVIIQVVVGVQILAWFELVRLSPFSRCFLRELSSLGLLSWHLMFS